MSLFWEVCVSEPELLAHKTTSSLEAVSENFTTESASLGNRKLLLRQNIHISLATRLWWCRHPTNTSRVGTNAPQIRGHGTALRVGGSGAIIQQR